ncbi:bifunctional phosphoribosyl-AMP cyclohydrolase/phosphoribosyl-ATP diphosphatase HisIE [Anaerosphaera multitolerans]|uniref:Histidine biosynthesis bifunctional protein HisIE n=1 Tax=Anaerosphaera multitolerans TaxID=2487351 RepID=A0A437S5J0_9FIRM|nr:bifunctional phosphoribosyl-AMP cyclohydrolase/phosphoribosyl-ATP diphosphatase HisIE [Anaerosphaera multitolerans]RVU54264.1 bifunctional phosphoribosyl-AMP cyclohydrolase/phosphoribosyl-ATP diphosphatase HisIE [Anaerosphaera multitolerans]
MNNIKWSENNLIPAIVQDALTGEVLMLAYMNEESLKKTLDTRETWFYSRTRKKLWNKGESSGNKQKVVEIILDCDCDTLLVKVIPSGPSCHTGKNSCFFNEVAKYKKMPNRQILFEEYKVIEGKAKNPKEGSYTNYLLEEGLDKICKKIGEEAAETIIGAKNNSKEELIYEVSDLLYHLNVLLYNQEITLDEIMLEIERRAEK